MGRIEDLKKGKKKKKNGADTLRNPTKNQHENNPGVASFTFLSISWQDQYSVSDQS